jgi:hypothetical protein
MGHNPRMDLCPKSMKKMKKIEEIWRNGFSGKNGGKNQMGGRRWVKWPERGRRWDGGWWGSDGWWWCVVDFGF